MFKNIKTIFSNTKRVLWPQFDHVHQIQSCIDPMCLFYGIPDVHVRMFPKWYIEKYVEHAIAVATFWPSNEDEDLFYEVWFCTEHFGYPSKTIPAKHPVSEGQDVDKMRVIVHEFAHHYAFHVHGRHIEPHGAEFRRAEAMIASTYGIVFVPFSRSPIYIPNIVSWMKKRWLRR